MPKVLIADDDPLVVDVVVKILESGGYTVESAADGHTAKHLVLDFGFDAMILDWQMPGPSGVEILDEYRKRGGKAPVLILTGLTAIERKETGFATGADDYLTKPFHPKELLIRVKALLRRGQSEYQETLAAAGINLDPASKTVQKDGATVDLSPNEFALLEFLMRNPNVVFSAETLIDRVWKSDAEVAPATIKVCVNRLRTKLGLPKEGVLKNVYGQGYLFESL